MNLIERIDQWSSQLRIKSRTSAAIKLLTYAELTAESNALAESLSKQLPDDHSPIAIQGHKEPEMLIAFLGAVKSGHPYIPLDSSLPSQRVETILETAKASIFLTPDKVKELVNQSREDSFSFQIHHPALDDAWYIIFTSGSTGEPKGVVITCGCLESFVNWILSEQQFAEGKEVFLNQAPFSFDLSVMDLYSSLVTGGTLIQLDQRHNCRSKKVISNFDHSEISVWVSTPSFAQFCLTEPTFKEQMLPQVNKFWFCGENSRTGSGWQFADAFSSAPKFGIHMDQQKRPLQQHPFALIKMSSSDTVPCRLADQSPIAKSTFSMTESKLKPENEARLLSRDQTSAWDIFIVLI